MYDRLDDLLTYNERKSAKTYQEFQLVAMKRLEGGQHVYTFASNDRLKYCAWLILQHDGKVDALKAPFQLPENAIVVHDIYHRPEENDEAEFHRFLEQVFSDIARQCDATPVHIVTSPRDRLTRAYAESMGFTLATKDERIGELVRL
jgi:hypothetical protein